MGKDFKTGLALWLKIADMKSAAVQFILFVVAEFMAVMFVAPRFHEGTEEIFLKTDMDADMGILVLAAIYIIIFAIAMKQIVYRAYGRNKDLFYQLAVSKRAGCICTIFLQLGWYYYSVVVLSVICSSAVVPEWCLVSAYTLLFFIAFGVYYSRADAGLCGRKRDSSGDRTQRSGSKAGNMFRNHPVLELFRITLYGLYSCRSLAVSKIILILFIVLCGRVHMLRGSVYFLSNAFFILLNDGYWKKESGNFQYFSDIGIPVSKYLCVHFFAGAGFNIVIPVLLFYGMTGEAVTAAVGFVLLVYLLIFWYLAQIYLYLIIGRDREAAVILCDVLFLAIAVLPPAGLAAMAWLYKRIARKWREEKCFR